MGKRLEKALYTEEDIPIVNKQKFSTLLVIRKMQTDSIVRHLTSLMLVKLTRHKPPCWQRCGATLIHWWREYVLIKPLWRAICNSQQIEDIVAQWLVLNIHSLWSSLGEVGEAMQSEAILFVMFYFSRIVESSRLWYYSPYLYVGQNISNFKDVHSLLCDITFWYIAFKCPLSIQIKLLRETKMWLWLSFLKLSPTSSPLLLNWIW